MNKVPPQKRPTSNTLDTLHELADAPRHAMPRKQLLLRLGERGMASAIANRAIAGLERREWIAVINDVVRLTDAGQAAAAGEGVQPQRKAIRSMKGRVGATRMPRGMF
jgi:hypothetical protein